MILLYIMHILIPLINICARRLSSLSLTSNNYIAAAIQINIKKKKPMPLTASNLWLLHCTLPLSQHGVRCAGASARLLPHHHLKGKKKERKKNSRKKRNNQKEERKKRKSVMMS